METKKTNLTLNQRQQKLYPDNAIVAKQKMDEFLMLYKSANKDKSTFYEKINALPNSHDMVIMMQFFEANYFDLDGKIISQKIDFSQIKNKSELKKLSESSSIAYDISKSSNGWVINTNGEIYSVRNHPLLFNFLTTMGVDVSSYIRVTVNSIGYAKLNFSTTKGYVESDNPFIITKEQVNAMYNLIKLNELKHPDKMYKTDFQDYIIDSMLGGFCYADINDTKNYEIALNNLKTIQKNIPLDFSINDTLKKANIFIKYPEKYKEYYGIYVNYGNINP